MVAQYQRTKRLFKGLPFHNVIGYADKVKQFDRSVVCIKENDKIFKILSIVASKDGSINVFFPYFKNKEAYVVKHFHEYFRELRKMSMKDSIIKECTVDKELKLSLHSTGFVQLSGRGIISGIDPITGNAKGMGIFSNPLSTPIWSGPTFGFDCWGLEKSFEVLTTKKNRDQYIILEKDSGDFQKRIFDETEPLNTYSLNFFIFPENANNFVYEYAGEPFIDHVPKNYKHNPGATLVYPVLDINNFKGVIGLFPSLVYTGFSKNTNSGYMLNSPGGSENQHIKSDRVSMFHLFCPRDLDQVYNLKAIKKLEL